MLNFPSFFNAGEPTYEIERSLRFDGSSYLSRTFDSSESSTFSAWVKRGDIPGTNIIFGARQTSGSTYRQIFFEGGSPFGLGGDNVPSQYAYTNNSFRDPSAWYHVVYSTGSNNTRIWINGVEASYRLNTTGTGGQITNSPTAYVGAGWNNANKFNGYIAEFHHIDGQQLDPDNFGEYDKNGVWRPIKVSLTGPNDGTTWSTYLTDASGFQASYPVTNAFNGTFTAASTARVSTTDTTSTFEPPSDIPYTSSVEVWTYYAGSVSLNGGSAVSVNNDQDWRTIATGSGSLDTLTFTSSSSSVYIGGIRIDGVTLIDGAENQYGANGFYLKFDPTATNGIGHDHSGNSNNWTPTGFNTSGTGTDVMSDTPTKNFCTVNPLSQRQLLNTSNGNLQINYTSTGSGSTINATQGASSGKYYWETTITSGSAVDYMAAVTSDWDVMAAAATRYPGQDANGWSYYRDGRKFHNNSFSSYGDSYGTGDVIGVALDLDNNKIWFSKNGTWQNSGNPLTGANPAFSNVSGTVFPAWAGYYPGTTHTCNFGQREFANPFGTIGATNYFNTVTYTGNNGTNAITGVGFQPDFVWIKPRSTSDHHRLNDSIRGVNKTLSSNLTSAEYGPSNAYLDSFDSDGFTVSSSDAGWNSSSHTYVAWCWKAGGTAVSNTDGTLPSSVSANNDAGFSVCTYTGAGGTSDFGHGLDTAPSVVIVKNRDASANWNIFHSAMGNTKYINLNNANGSGTTANMWNNTSPTSSVVHIGSDNTTSGNDFVAYCFAEKTGVSKFGSYTGDGSNDGPVISCGFRPAMVMIKWYESVNSAESWQLYDNKRGGNPNNTILQPDSASQEESPSDRYIQFTEDGFQLKSSGQQINRSGAKYIFAAWAGTFTADDTFKSLNTANLPAPTIKDGSKYFKPVTYTADGVEDTQITVGFQPDLVWGKARNQAFWHALFDSVRGGDERLKTNSTQGQDQNAQYIKSFDSDGFTLGTDANMNYNNATMVAWCWKAGGTASDNTDGNVTSSVSVNQDAGFSIVKYTSSTSTKPLNVGHGLGVKPSFILTKNIDSTASWGGYHSGFGATKSLGINSTGAAYASNDYWNNTEPTSTVFTVFDSNNTHSYGTTDDFIAYCFTEVQGYSKFGTYTGNGSTDGQFVPLSFAPAMILIKKNAVANWVIMDKERYTYNPRTQVLYPSGSSPEVSLSGTADIDFLSNGFKLRGSWDNINGSGSTYYFAAFAENPFGGSGVSPTTAR